MLTFPMVDLSFEPFLKFSRLAVVKGLYTDSPYSKIGYPFIAVDSIFTCPILFANIGTFQA